jgi:hypothetical protein
VTLPSKNRHGTLIIVTSVALVVGMGIAILLLFVWREHPSVVAEGPGLNAALTLCPPYLLVRVARDMDDTALSRIIIGGAVVIGNGSLYAGVATFVIWVMSRVWPRRQA